MNSRQRRKLEAIEHQKQRELYVVLCELRQRCYEKYGRTLPIYGLSAEEAIAKYEAVLNGTAPMPMPKRNVRVSMGLASLMAMGIGEAAR